MLPWLTPALAVTLALTFDDLPSQVRHDRAPTQADLPAQQATTDALLATLAAHHAPAAVFVNCGNLQGDVLDRWVKAGAEVGNHTHTHVHSRKVEPDAWREEVLACDRTLKAAGVTPRTFRYPYLRRPEDRAAREVWLQEQGYTVAPVTVDPADWLFSIAHTRGRTLDELGDAYVDEVAQAVIRGAELAQQRHQATPPHVVLLHVNELNAQLLDRVLTCLEADGHRFVTLGEAMADPYYAHEDVQTGDDSLVWQLRIAPAWTPEEGNWFSEEQGRLWETWLGE